MKPKNKPDEAFGVTAAEESVGFLLWQVTTLWQRKIKKALDPIGITHPQFVLLASLLWLSSQKKYVTQIDLSQHSKIDPMTTSMIIRKLQMKQWIKRREHHQDTRAKIITLTDEGIGVARQAIKIIDNVDTSFFHALGIHRQKFMIQLLSLLPKEG